MVSLLTAGLRTFLTGRPGASVYQDLSLPPVSLTGGSVPQAALTSLGRWATCLRTFSSTCKRSVR